MLIKLTGCTLDTGERFYADGSTVELEDREAAKLVRSRRAVVLNFDKEVDDLIGEDYADSDDIDDGPAPVIQLRSVTEKINDLLVDNGYSHVEDIASLDSYEPLTDISGIGDKTAKRIYAEAKDLIRYEEDKGDKS